jgi:glycosyltransferase involved in cell wall biosynthesis
MNSISYAITVCNELEEINRLVDTLVPILEINDEIVILYDTVNGTKEVVYYLEAIRNKSKISVHHGKLEGSFSAFKNKLNSYCRGDFIFNIDADEELGEGLKSQVKLLLSQNPTVDVFHLPRINTVEGITPDYIAEQNWKVTSIDLEEYKNKEIINYPDYQVRIYKNNPDILWVGEVHEILIGFKNYVVIPPSIHQLALRHNKTFEKQKKQNELYKTLG